MSYIILYNYTRIGTRQIIIVYIIIILDLFHHGEGEGEFKDPRHITSDHNGFIYVCDLWNNRIKIL